MSTFHFYHTACKHYGKPVRVVDRNGKCYRGVIKDVTPRGIYLGSRGYGFFIPFFSIISIVLLTSLFLF